MIKNSLLLFFPKRGSVFLFWMGMMVSSMAADYPPMNHGGANLNLVHGDCIWGLHTGIGTLTLAADAVIRVAPFDGASTSMRGMVELHAVAMDIAGTLDASGSGYTGGGGAPGGGFSHVCWIGHYAYPQWVGPYQGGTADYGDWLSSGFFGSIYGGMPDPGDPGHGDGHYGGDSYGGIADGGYMAPGVNGDFSTDDATTMGSGGGGGLASAGWLEEQSGSPCGIVHGGVGGGGGGRGGGTIRLFVLSSFFLRNKAVLDASGLMGGNTTGGEGGDVSPPQQGLPGGPAGTSGGRGAGGGILLQLQNASQVQIEAGSILRSVGGNFYGANGGTIKLRFNPDGEWSNSATLLAPRICTASECWSRIADWFSY